MIIHVSTAGKVARIEGVSHVVLSFAPGDVLPLRARLYDAAGLEYLGCAVDATAEAVDALFDKVVRPALVRLISEANSGV